MSKVLNLHNTNLIKKEELGGPSLEAVIIQPDNELIGYTIDFPISNKFEGFVEDRDFGNLDISDYAFFKKYKGKLVLNKDKEMIGVIYNEESPCYEIEDKKVGGIGIMYLGGEEYWIPLKHKNWKVVENNTYTIGIKDPIVLLLIDYYNNFTLEDDQVLHTPKKKPIIDVAKMKL